MKRKPLFELNSSRQDDLLALHCLHHADIEAWKILLAYGLPLTAFMLNTMLIMEFSDATIKEVIKSATKIDKDIFFWMEENLTTEELADILPLFEADLPRNWPTNDECVKLGLWHTLCRRQKFSIVAQHAPEILEKDGHPAAAKALLELNFDKYAPIFLAKGNLSSIYEVQGGWKFLIDNGKAQFVLLKGRSLVPEEAPLYCLSKGYIKELCQANYLSFLEENGAKHPDSPYYKDYKKAVEEWCKEFDWDGAWKSSFSRRNWSHAMLERARENITVPACRDFLKKHGSWLDKLKLAWQDF